MRNPLIYLILFSGLASTVGAASHPKVEELDQIVAVVNNDVITLTELNKQITQLKKQMGEKSVNLPPEPVLQRQMLERAILERLQLELAKRSSIRVDDENLNRVIDNIARENHLSLEQFRDVMAKDGVAFADFREQIRNEMIINQLRRSRVDSTITVSEQEVDNQLSHVTNQGDEYHLAQIVVALIENATPDIIEKAQQKAKGILEKIQQGADFSQTAMTSSDAPQALQGGDLGWLKQGQLPTALADIVPNMKVGEVIGPIRSSSGFHLIKLLDKRADQAHHVVEQALARHILVKTDQITTDSVARERLGRIRARIIAGEDFAQLARANSADTVSAADGGNLGWVSPGTMVPEFEEVMNKLKPGDVSEPFQSRYGWHILQVMSRRSHDDTREYQRNQARQQIMQRKISEETESWLRRLRAEAYVDVRLGQ